MYRFSMHVANILETERDLWHEKEAPIPTQRTFGKGRSLRLDHGERAFLIHDGISTALRHGTKGIQVGFSVAI